MASMPAAARVPLGSSREVVWRWRNLCERGGPRVDPDGSGVVHAPDRAFMAAAQSCLRYPTASESGIPPLLAELVLDEEDALERLEGFLEAAGLVGEAAWGELDRDVARFRPAGDLVSGGRFVGVFFSS